MSEPKFTPGPWHFVNGNVPRVTSENASIAGVHKTGRFTGNINDDRVWANGCLIAAAPELYEAVAQLVAKHSHIPDDKLHRIASGTLLPTEEFGGLTNEDASKILRGRAALVKARGEP